jgi:hypothetical protein
MDVYNNDLTQIDQAAAACMALPMVDDEKALVQDLQKILRALEGDQPASWRRGPESH